MRNGPGDRPGGEVQRRCATVPNVQKPMTAPRNVGAADVPAGAGNASERLSVSAASHFGARSPDVGPLLPVGRWLFNGGGCAGRRAFLQLMGGSIPLTPGTAATAHVRGTLPQSAEPTAPSKRGGREKEVARMRYAVLIAMVVLLSLALAGPVK